MAKNQTRRLKPAVITADCDALSALQAIPGYRPANALFELPALLERQRLMQTAQTSEAQAQAALAAARDVANAAEWAFHNAMLGAKDQIIAQYGDDSNEVQALGLKKKSEYKSPGGARLKAPDE